MARSAVRFRPTKCRVTMPGLGSQPPPNEPTWETVPPSRWRHALSSRSCSSENAAATPLGSVPVWARAEEQSAVSGGVPTRGRHRFGEKVGNSLEMAIDV